MFVKNAKKCVRTSVAARVQTTFFGLPSPHDLKYYPVSLYGQNLIAKRNKIENM